MIKYPIYVTLDTNILDAAKFDFERKSTLQILSNYVKKGKVKIVLSNIVIKEAEKHIAERGARICSIIRRLRTESLKTVSEYQIKQIGLNHVLELVNKDEIKKKSIDLLHKYIEKLDAEILDTSKIDLDAIIDDYFEIQAPFQQGEKKRKEFPDAFIANQIRERFGHNEIVVIISADKGFIDACQPWDNHLFFSSLGDFYDELNKQEKFYTDTKKLIKSQKHKIETSLYQYIEDNENIDVIGKSYDRKGISEGYDYIETCLNNISEIAIKLHSVDEIDEKKSIVTLQCKASFSMDCFYEDYVNAPWDPEEKQYIYVITDTIREEHKANFACRIEIDREEKIFEILPFKIVLCGDSRKNRYEIKNNLNEVYDYEQEIEDMDRKAVGLNPLRDYEVYLEEELPDSNMFRDYINRFSKINDLYSEYEELLLIYDSLKEVILGKKDLKVIIDKMSARLEKISDFPSVIDVDNISKEEIGEIIRWINSKTQEAMRKADERKLPDSIRYGDNIKIVGIDGSVLYLKIDEININPSEGEKEWIYIKLYNQSEIIASGEVELTVGYVEYNEDGGIGNALQDGINYNYEQIIEVLDEYIQEQSDYVCNEKIVVGVIKGAIEDMC